MFRAVNREPIDVRTNVPSFATAVEAIEDEIARDRADPLLAETALPRLYHHGAAVERAVVLYHGFTNCPQQFDELARRLHARGCNVYVPRLPLHGRRDRLTHALAGLNDGLLAHASTASYQLARGLGTRVCAAGLSLGGSMALYLALTEPIDLAVPIAPFLMPIGVPGWLGVPVMNAIARLPERYVWWDPRIKERSLPDYAYPGFPSRALARCVFFGNLVAAAAGAPRAARCTLVTNARETAVSNGAAQRLLQGWIAGGAPYVHETLRGLGKPRHDIIDPTTFPQARTLVYPALESIVLG
jgi:carboxylesterase